MSIIESAPAVENVGPASQPPAKRASRKAIIGIVAGSVVIAAGLFGGGIATGASLSGGASSATQGQFGGQGGTPPSGQMPSGTTGG
jgi:hypothetical protein